MGASHLVIIGAHRDSTHEAVTSNPGAFGTTPLAVLQISPRLAGYLAAYPDGPQVWCGTPGRRRDCPGRRSALVVCVF